MRWLEVHIDTNHAGLEPVETMLSALGIDGVVIDDEEEFQDFLDNNHQYWDYVDEDLRREMQGRSRITFYLAEGEKAAGPAQAEPGGLRPSADEPGKHRKCRLGEQLEAVLSAHPDRPAAAGGAGVAAGGSRRPGGAAGGAGAPGAGPGPHVWNRQPCHHPAVPDGAGAEHSRRRAGAGPGLRQRHFVHRCPEAGGRHRPGGGHRRQVPGCGV